MDEWLARVYGTGGAAAPDDIEKIAQAEMAQQMAQQEGIDLSQLSPEQVESLGQEVLGGQQGGVPGQQQMQQPGMGQQPGMEPGGEIDPSQLTDEHVQQAQQILEAAQAGQQVDPAMLQEAQAIMQIVEQMQGGGGDPQAAEMAKVAEASAKFEEADLLGRVMAHAFNAESEKIAAAKLGPANAMGIARHHVNQAAGAVKGKAQQIGGHLKARMHPQSSHPLHHVGAAAQHVSNHRGAYGAGAAGAAGLGAGYAAGHHMAKEATIGVIEKAAMQQAANILSANGIDPATGQPTNQMPQQPTVAAAPGGAPQADAQVALGGVIEKRAHQILRNLGWNIV
jgi:hypothetical protein